MVDLPLNSTTDADQLTLSLQTVYFHDNDRAEAARLGRDLYELLTRPANDPLAFGAGIPVLSAVRWDRVVLDAAEIVVVIPVLGSISYQTSQQHIIDELQKWHATLGDGRLLIVPVASVWRNVEGKLPVKQFLTELYGKSDPRRKTLDEIVLAVARLLEHDRKNVRLFISHAKADLAATDSAAKQIHDYIVTDTTGQAFFDAADLLPGESLLNQLDNAVQSGVFIAVRGDAYSSRSWCQRELLTAKRQKLPALTVEILKTGERRSSPYGGNGPCVVWEGNAATITSRAMVEWVRSACFRKEAQRLARVAELPDDVVVLARPPELLDLTHGELFPIHARLALHPDPELPVFERQILKEARPRLQLVTPTTAFRRLLNCEDASSAVESPLDGLQVAMSLSDSPDVNGPDGFTEEHVRDATVYVARSLISAGAAIAYGGDFRTNGYTHLLADLIASYNQTAAKTAQDLHSYLGATVKLEDGKDLPVKAHHLDEWPDLRALAILPRPSENRQPDSLYFSEMRRLMAVCTSARILLGGAAEPNTEMKSGYKGRLPGIVEEAWRTLSMGRPLYVVGGFGGAAALVADLLEGRVTPERLQDKSWAHLPSFKKIAEEVDINPFRKALGLPDSIDDLANTIRDLATPLLRSDEAALKWNGLTVQENHRLLRTRDPVVIASLVLNGLLNVVRVHGSGKLQVELVSGSITNGNNLDAIAVGVFDKIPLGGAGAALDDAIGGRASTARAAGKALISLKSPDIDADWLYLASLGPLEGVEGLDRRVEQAAVETANQAQRHGFHRLGVVTFGGAVVTDMESMADAMLRGLDNLRGQVTISWFETNPDRFNRLYTKLASHPEVQVTTRSVTKSVGPQTDRVEELILQVNLRDQDLTITTLPPSGTAIASSRRTALTAGELVVFSTGSGSRMRSTPELETLKQRGAQLAEKLFGSDATQLLTRCQHARVTIIHDGPASKLPFELLSTSDAVLRPAVQAGINRRLAVEGVPTDLLFAKPPKVGRLNVLLISNPTQDLPGTEKEAAVVRNILTQSSQAVKLMELTGPQATKEAVQQTLCQADVLHYCGHAFFEASDAGQSGLILSGREPLTLADLKKISTLPRVAFVNACEAGRVRGSTTTEAAAFAEYFLRSGIDAYLGTYWEVGDTAAASFATGVYTRLAEGQTLESAVTKSRADLLNAGEPDWANYILYGDGHFKLVVG